jgi:hypothetical protein
MRVCGWLKRPRLGVPFFGEVDGKLHVAVGEGTVGDSLRDSRDS